MFNTITSCRCCGYSNLTQFIDLNDQPLANNYHDKSKPLDTFPLQVNVCGKCWHTQLSVVVDPDILFKHYVYVSGTSTTLQEYFKEFAFQSLLDWANNGILKDKYVPNLNVLDVACNDGSQLDAYKTLGCATYGIDPAENLVPIAADKGHTVVCDYMTQSAVDKFNGVKFDIITAQNVFAHTDDILEFLLACKKVLADDGTLLIQTSQANMYANGEFDTIYHEHLSFFNTTSMKNICKRAGLWLNQVRKTNIHGTSYVFQIEKQPNNMSNIASQIGMEKEQGLYTLDTYVQFGVKALQTVTALKDAVDTYRSHGVPVIGAGAAAKGMTVLNYGHINMDMVLDENPLKQGLYTPGMDTPINSFDAVSNYPDNIVIVPLAWNFESEIRAKVNQRRVGMQTTYLSYFPTLKVTSA